VLAAATQWPSLGPAPAAARLLQPGATAVRALTDSPEDRGEGDKRGPEGQSPTVYLAGKSPRLRHP
jgi:hypothetical protein